MKACFVRKSFNILGDANKWFSVDAQDIMKFNSSLFVWSSSAKITTDLKSNVKKYLHGKETGTYATFDDWKFVMTNIYELTEDGNFYKYCCVMVWKNTFANKM